MHSDWRNNRKSRIDAHVWTRADFESNLFFYVLFQKKAIPPTTRREMVLLSSLYFFPFDSIDRNAEYSPSSPLHADRMRSLLFVLPLYFSSLMSIHLIFSPLRFCHVIDKKKEF